jgi:hypothetical protein
MIREVRRPLRHDQQDDNDTNVCPSCTSIGVRGHAKAMVPAAAMSDETGGMSD